MDLSKFVKIRDELNETQSKINFLVKELDHATHELIQYLKENKLLTIKTLGKDDQVLIRT